MSNRSKTEIIAIAIAIIITTIVGIVVENSKHESGVVERLFIHVKELNVCCVCLRMDVLC